MNAGPGIGHITDIRYSAAVNINGTIVGHRELLFNELVALLIRGGLKTGKDFNFEFITAGFPLAVHRHPSEGIEFAALTSTFWGRVRTLEVSVSVKDSVGDEHRKSLPCEAAREAESDHYNETRRWKEATSEEKQTNQ
jgi:hypothetical protein